MSRDWLPLIVMSVFCALFVLRVLAQFLQFIYPVDWIPGFAKALPAFFHMVVAGFILLLGLHIRRRRRNRKIFVSSARF